MSGYRTFYAGQRNGNADDSEFDITGDEFTPHNAGAATSSTKYYDFGG